MQGTGDARHGREAAQRGARQLPVLWVEVHHGGHEAHVHARLRQIELRGEGAPGGVVETTSTCCGAYE